MSGGLFHGFILQTLGAIQISEQNPHHQPSESIVRIHHTIVLVVGEGNVVENTLQILLFVLRCREGNFQASDVISTQESPRSAHMTEDSVILVGCVVHLHSGLINFLKLRYNFCLLFRLKRNVLGSCILIPTAQVLVHVEGLHGFHIHLLRLHPQS